VKTLPRADVLGIDVGGTKIAAGIVGFPEGQVLHRRVIPTAPSRGGGAVLNDVVLLAGSIANEAMAAGRVVSGIGVGICELVNADGEILSSHCLDWRRADIAEKLSPIGPTVIEADVRAAAVAEWLYGVGKGLRTFLYITIGTGISCCLMLDGRPYLGARGATGTMASSAMSIRCERCGWINQRTSEELASGPGLVRSFRQQAGREISTSELLSASAAGDPIAGEVVRIGAQALGSSLGMLINVLDPEAVVVGGGLGLSEGPFWNELVDAIRKHVWSPVHNYLPVLRAATGRDAGLIGAAAASWQRVGGR
jgi:glucokinase